MNRLALNGCSIQRRNLYEIQQRTPHRLLLAPLAALDAASSRGQGYGPKQTRPQDQPCPLTALPKDDRALIRSVIPDLGA